MNALLQWLSEPEGLTPHGFCLLWDPGLLWLHAAADGGIALAYYTIPLALVYFVRRRRDLAFPGLFLLFSLFILACGTTHVLAIVTLWLPWYWLEGGMKLVTACLSIATAIILWRLLPAALAWPSPDTLRRQVGERDEALALLRASETRYRRLYDNAPAPMHTMDEAGCMVGANHQWTALLGYSLPEILGRPFADLMTPESADAFLLAWPDLLAGIGPRDQLEHQVRREDGTMLDVLVSLRAEREPDGVVRVLTVLVDISDRKRAEADLLAREAQLRQSQKLQAIGQLTGGIAHDFNNMLTAIDGTLELIRAEWPDNARIDRLVATALHSTAKSASLTAQMLSFSRQQRLDPQVLEPAEVVAGMATLLSRTVGEQVQLDIQPPPATPCLCLVDRSQLESALLNLVRNARAAIAGTGTVTVGVASRRLDRPATDPSFINETVAPGQYVVISVADTGGGMSEEVRRQAFEPFFTTQPLGQGTGLGLSQIHGFVHQSGGHVLLHSTPGQGSLVELLLPRAEQPALMRPLPRHAASPGTEIMPRARLGETLLLAEDEPAVLEIAADMLEGLGYRVVRATNGDVALQLLHAEPEVQVLFTDIVMPGSLNGIDLALAARQARPGLGVVFASGYSTERVLTRWPEPACFLQKPYQFRRLACMIRDSFDRSALINAE